MGSCYMINRKIVAMLVSLFFTNSVYSHEVKLGSKYVNESLCYDGERVIASSILENSKTVSFCALKNDVGSVLDVKYRYGSQDNIEIEYPKGKDARLNKMYYVDESGGTVNSERLVFYIGKYRYSYVLVNANVILIVERLIEHGYERVFIKYRVYLPSELPVFPDRNDINTLFISKDRFDY